MLMVETEGKRVIEGNKVTVRDYAEGAVYCHLYTITPQLKFVLDKEWQEEE